MHQAWAHYSYWTWRADTGDNHINLGSLRQMDTLRELDLPILDDRFEGCHAHAVNIRHTTEHIKSNKGALMSCTMAPVSESIHEVKEKAV